LHLSRRKRPSGYRVMVASVHSSGMSTVCTPIWSRAEPT
jgi:hypothetical protein